MQFSQHNHMSILSLAATGLMLATSAVSAASLSGQVLGAGAPIANSTVTLWAASAGAPKQLAQSRTSAEGRFTLNAPTVQGKEATLYLVAKGGKAAASKDGRDNPVIALM